MATELRITKWCKEGFEEILCNGGVQGLVAEATDMIQARANANNTRGGKGFGAGTRIGYAGKAFRSQRALGFVYTTDHASCVAESEDKALSRAL